MLELAVGPNPSRGSTQVSYALPRAGVVNLAVFDLQGRMVRSLYEGHAEAGRRTSLWDGRLADGRQASGGVYFVRLAAGGASAITRKLTLER